MIVVFLQNAWSPRYAGREWPRRSWLYALKASRSGQRLRLLVDDLDQCENVSPVVTETPSGNPSPDAEHVVEVLKRRKPTVVIACGKNAEKALRKLWNGPLLAIPHPAHRVVTNALYIKARLMIENGFTERCALRQGRGEITQEEL